MAHYALWRAIEGPLANFVDTHFFQRIGGLAGWDGYVRWKVSCGVELLVEAAVMSAPPLLVALLGGGFARRIRAGQPS